MKYSPEELYFGPLQMQARTPVFLSKWQRILREKQKTLSQLARARQTVPEEKVQDITLRDALDHRVAGLTINRPSIQIGRLMPFSNLASLITPSPVDSLPAHDRRPLGYVLGPTLHMGVFVGRKELSSRIHIVAHQLAVPRPTAISAMA